MAIGCSICRTMVVRCPRVGVYKKTGHCGTKRTKNGCVSSFNYVVDPSILNCQSRSSKPPLPVRSGWNRRRPTDAKKACENISGYPSELNGRARTDLHPKKLFFGKDRKKKWRGVWELVTTVRNEAHLLTSMKLDHSDEATESDWEGRG